MGVCLQCGRGLVEKEASWDDPRLNCGGDCRACQWEAEFDERTGETWGGDGNAIALETMAKIEKLWGWDEL